MPSVDLYYWPWYNTTMGIKLVYIIRFFAYSPMLIEIPYYAFAKYLLCSKRHLILV